MGLSSVNHHQLSGTTTTSSLSQCHCKTEGNIFAPVKSKMKVLKKIKRKIGLGKIKIIPVLLFFFCYI